MANVVAITLIKRMSYRGDATEEFSNKYFLSGSEPATDADWKALADALIVQEKTAYPSGISVVRAYGYWQDETDNSPSAVWSYDYLAHTATVAGTLSTTGGVLAPGDAAAVLEWKTSRLNSKGKPIYLRKYFHGALFATGQPDNLGPTQITALNALGTKLMDGSFLDARTLRSQRHSETLLSRTTMPYTTTRTLHRRGRRP